MRSEKEVREYLAEHKAKLKQAMDPTAHTAGVQDWRWLQGRVEMLEWVLAGADNEDD